MPLMVNPSSGSRLYGQNPSILTFVASTTLPSVAGSTVSTLIQAIASASATGTAVATISAPSGKNMTLVLGDEAAEQTGMDSMSA
jgi:hypothetical protein